ncbi:DoxX family membrane protein [Amycolatopsis sp. NBC_01286]|uniref:DoxX family membrane protein n=1 Tax=Amycolatopsis sp. NBC_01286 TaxID=2903560 RepID=UPI002E161B3B|nr:DoxX family membrane protein [Amycolatopsis sp. NBC_01286]
MSVQDRSPSPTTPFIPSQTARTAERPKPGSSARGPALAVLRIMMGLTFLWAFLDKLFGLGYSTSPAQAWISGGSPTKGFLGHVQVGPMQSTLRDWAGAGWADWLFMLALLGLGIALLLGVALRPAAAAGTILLALMWIAEWPLAQSTSAGTATSSTNPLIDYHLVYLVVLIALAAFAAGDTWGLGHRWAKLDLVRRTPWLR